MQDLKCNFKKILSKVYAPNNYISKCLIRVKSINTFMENMEQIYSNKISL